MILKNGDKISVSATIFDGYSLTNAWSRSVFEENHLRTKCSGRVIEVKNKGLAKCRNLWSPNKKELFLLAHSKWFTLKMLLCVCVRVSYYVTKLLFLVYYIKFLKY